MDQRGNRGHAVVTYKLYVEGGGDSKALRTKCRMGFSAFFQKAGLKGIMPCIVACGSREKAYDMFCTAVAEPKSDERALLLVDSEAPVAAKHMIGKPEEWRPWEHLRCDSGDDWVKPASSRDADCHLMVQVMESWFLADKNTLKDFFGQGFHFNSLPAHTNIEAVSKDAVYQGLKNATRDCKSKCCYKKGDHSFDILIKIAPDAVCGASSWAKRLVTTLQETIAP